MKLLPISHTSNWKDSSRCLTLTAGQTNHSNTGTACYWLWVSVFVVASHAQWDYSYYAMCMWMQTELSQTWCLSVLNSHTECDSDGVTFEGDFLFLNLFSLLFKPPPPSSSWVSLPRHATVHTVSEGLREEKASIPFLQLEHGRTIIIIIIIIITLP